MKIRRLGIFCLPGRGHLYPACALGRRLKDRGYQVTVFNRNIARSIVTASGLLFEPIEDQLVHRSRHLQLQPSGRPGPSTLDIIHNHAALVLRHAAEAISRLKIDALLVDQADLAAGTLADLLCIPFVTVCFFPPVYLSDESPPFIYRWRPEAGFAKKTGRDFELRRNRRGNTLLRQLVDPTLELVNTHRRLWKLAEIADINEIFSRQAIIAQIPQAFDFPRQCPPKTLFYTGLFDDGQRSLTSNFPWHRLNGKPMIYATMGTVRNGMRQVFDIIASASAAFRVQLVISLGGMALVPEEFTNLSGDQIVVHYGPQTNLLKRACLTICHGGLNTTLESIASRVPLIAIPVTDDQPGVAARIEWTGVGLALPWRRLSVARLREVIDTMLTSTKYFCCVNRLQAEFQKTNGLDRASDIIDQIVSSSS